MEIKNETLLTYQQLTKLALSTRRQRIMRYVMGVFVLWVLFWECYRFATSGVWFDSYAAYLWLFPIIYYIYLYFMTRKTYKRLIGENISHQTYIFKDEEIETNANNDLSKDSHATYPYKKFTNIEIRKDYIFLYITPYSMIPIDKKGFSSETDKEAVIALLKEKVKG
ncbi:MAG: YcxB family protein [Paludibacteraceae bacterium]|nr:YcxB family protein [Paludibacteraceae bacterium]